MPPRHNKSSVVRLQPIKSDSKIHFVLHVEGNWDFNRDLAEVKHSSGVVVDGTGTELNHYARGGHSSFRAAFQRFMADRVFDRTENMFESIQISDMQCSPECEQSYQALRSELTVDERAKAEKELQELEQKTQELKKKLGK